jgi:hypothetical protein
MRGAYDSGMRVRAAVFLIGALLVVAIARITFGQGAIEADLRPLAAARADARVDGTVTEADRAALSLSVERSVSYVEELFGHRFAAKPKLVIFGNTALFNAGLAELFDYSEGNASLAGTNYGGIYDHATSTIAVNLQTIGPDARAATLEHELTHYIVRELAAGHRLPAWFEEGIATIAQRHGEAASRWPEEDALIGRAIAASGRVSLASLDDLRSWHETYPRFGEALYQFAENAASQVRERVTWRGVLALLSAVAAGRSFADAYRAASGESVGDLDVRLRQDRAPALIFRRLPSGDAQWTIFTGKPLTEERITIAGNSTYVVSFVVRTDDLGLYRGTFGSTAPPGTYLVSGTGARVEISTGRR